MQCLLVWGVWERMPCGAFRVCTCGDTESVHTHNSRVRAYLVDRHGPTQPDGKLGAFDRERSYSKIAVLDQRNRVDHHGFTVMCAPDDIGFYAGVVQIRHNTPRSVDQPRFSADTSQHHHQCTNFKSHLMVRKTVWRYHLIEKFGSWRVVSPSY